MSEYQERWFDERAGEWKLYPHLSMAKIRNRPGEYPLWRCRQCGVEGTMDELEIVSCTERRAKCIWCGEGPLCAPHCVGIALALSDPKVYVIGGER